MIKVRLCMPGQFAVDRTMPAAPRVGETIALHPEVHPEHRTYQVHGVHWYPDEHDFDVYIVLRG